MQPTRIVLAAFVIAAGTASAQVLDSLTDKVGNAVKGAATAVGDTAGAVGDDVKGTADKLTGATTAEEQRAEIDAAAREGLDKLFASNAGAKALYDHSYGYAVFDTKKFSFLITTGTGAGVAVNRKSGKRTYMKMFTGGVNVGAGGQYFKLIFLFEDAGSFNSFVANGWEATGQASAVAGKDSIEAEARFVEGKAIYQVTEAGIMLAANLAGTKYWKADDLN